VPIRPVMEYIAAPMSGKRPESRETEMSCVNVRCSAYNNSVKSFAALARTPGTQSLFAHACGIFAHTELRTGRRLPRR